jgi:hypothetical protein
LPRLERDGQTPWYAPRDQETDVELEAFPPGAVVTRKLALDHYFRPTTPGTYRLEVVYRNDRPLERNGRRAFVGQIRATPLELAIR